MSALGTRQFFRYHPSIGHTFIPGLRARAEHEGGGFLIRVNETGFRCEHEFEQRKPPDRFRVLLFGDSFTAGDGVSNKHRFGDVLERRIPGLEIYNFGLSATGQDQQWLTYQAFARDIEHDLLIIASPIENIYRIVARYMKFATADGEGYRLFARPYFELRAGELELHNVPVPPDPVHPNDIPDEAHVFPAAPRDHQRARALVNRLGPRATELARGLKQRFSATDPAPDYLWADSPSWQLLRTILERWIGESSAPTILFPIPMHQYVEEIVTEPGYQARFAELHAPPRVIFHDPLPHLLEHSKAERRAFRFATDPHPTAAGHAALASALEPAIRAQMATRREEVSA